MCMRVTTSELSCSPALKEPAEVVRESSWCLWFASSKPSLSTVSPSFVAISTVISSGKPKVS